MIIPWKSIDNDTLDNLIKEFVLREGTDYGDSDYSLQDKIDQVKQQLRDGSVSIVFSELHETVDIRPTSQISAD